MPKFQGLIADLGGEGGGGVSDGAMVVVWGQSICPGTNSNN